MNELSEAILIADIVNSVESTGVCLWAEGSRLRFRAPAGALDEGTRRILRDNRSAVVDFLRQRGAGRSEHLPVAENQQGLWFLHRMWPESAAYNVAFVTRVAGKVDQEILQEALQILVDRHELLRSVFPEGEAPLRNVSDYSPVQFRRCECRGLSDDALRDAVVAEYRRPFDLAEKPAFRATLFTRSEGEHLLMLAAHHIVVDGTGLFVLVEELIDIYGALHAGAPVPAPDDAAPYRQFVTWQVEQSVSNDAAREYWRQQLTPSPDPLELPSRFSTRGAVSLQGDTVRSALDEGTVSRLRAIGREAGVTDYVILLTLWSTFLQRLTGQGDLIVGTPAQGRPERQFSRTIGHFVNTLPLRIRECTRRPFVDALREVRSVVLGAFTHQDYPLIRMLDEEQLMSGTGQPFQVAFVLQDFSRFGRLRCLIDRNVPGTVPFGSAELEYFAIDQMEAQFPLSLDAYPSAEGFELAWRFDTGIVDRTDVSRWAATFDQFVRAVAASPHQRLAEIPFLSSEDRELLSRWNATEREYPSDLTLVDLLDAQVGLTPEAVAVRSEEYGIAKTLTYAELHRRSNSLAARLQDLGAGRDVPVAVQMERSAELVVALMAVLKSGGAYVPIDPGYPIDRKKFMLEDCKAPVVLTQRELQPELQDSEAMVIAVDDIWSTLDDGKAPIKRPRPDALAYVIYTSGSTGRPKGAMIEHRSIGNRLLWMQEFYSLDSTDVVVQKTPYSFDVSVWEFFWPLISGASLVMARPEGHKDPQYLLQMMERHGVTTVHFVPSMLNVFLDSVAEARLTKLRRVICSGEALSPVTRRRFFELLPEVDLTNLYGPTEAAVDVSWWRCTPEDPSWTVPIGWPVANTQLHVLDERMQRVPIGVPGELYIGGVQVGRGYLNRPELTAGAFLPDPWHPDGRLYRTGDRVRHLADGAIEFLGRLDHQVKVRGYRIELGEIEARLQSHPRIKDAVVVARDERIVGYVVPEGGEVPAEELRRWVGETLPEYMVPSLFVALESLPLTPNGKVDRKALPEVDSGAGADDALLTPPESPVQLAMAEIWSDVLGVASPALESSFFLLGGHSLLAARAVNAIEDRLGVSLPLRIIFERPHLGELAAYVEEQLEGVAVSPSGEASLEVFDF